MCHGTNHLNELDRATLLVLSESNPAPTRSSVDGIISAPAPARCRARLPALLIHLHAEYHAMELLHLFHRSTNVHLDRSSMQEYCTGQAVVVHDRPLIAGEIKFQTPESLTMKTRLAYIIYLLSAYREVWSAHVGPQHKSLALQRLRPCAGAVSLGGDRPPWRSLTGRRRGGQGRGSQWDVAGSAILPRAPPRTRTCRPHHGCPRTRTNTSPSPS